MIAIAKETPQRGEPLPCSHKRDHGERWWSSAGATSSSRRMKLSKQQDSHLDFDRFVLYKSRPLEQIRREGADSLKATMGVLSPSTNRSLPTISGEESAH